MLNHLQNEFNNSQTANGAFAYASTKSEVLDLFALGGAFRSRNDQDVVQLFSKAFGENPLLAMKTLFYLRDVTEGQGERRFFRVAIKHLALHSKNVLNKNLHLIPHFGRWDDLLPLLETSLKGEVSSLIANQLKADFKSDSPSLLAKWMPSENASSFKTQRYAKILRKDLGLSSREYRKMLSSLRAKLNILETKLSEKNYSEINYSKIPSKAGLIYRGAFFRNDEENYKSFLDSLTKGEVKINAKTLYPYDIINKAFKGYSGVNISSYFYNEYHGAELNAEEIQLLDAQWKSLPDFIGENSENSIAVVDTSGSMSGEPINVAVSLGIYLAERNKGVFHNHFLTFNSTPSLKKIVGSNIVEKARNLSDATWGGSTNIQAVFEKILETAVKNNVSQEEMISKVYIVSDMQFNQCVGVNPNIFTHMEKTFKLAGYTLPSIVFWNVNAFKSNTPFTMNEHGVQLVSGMSPSIFKQLMSNNSVTPYELMMEVIDSDRYKEVTV